MIRAAALALLLAGCSSANSPPITRGVRQYAAGAAFLGVGLPGAVASGVSMAAAAANGNEEVTAGAGAGLAIASALVIIGAIAIGAGEDNLEAVEVETSSAAYVRRAIR